jgi:putative oxidoreductase
MDQRIPLSLLLLRLGVFIVMLMWTLDKFFNPGHAGKVYEGFYGISMTGETVMALIGAAELVLIVAFVAGAFRRVTYGAVLILHGISTLSSWSQYLNPFDNLLFFAAWPMLAACIALYLLRDLDTRWSVDALRSGG